VIDGRSGEMVTAIRSLTHGEGAHKTLDASSAPEARAAAVQRRPAAAHAGASAPMMARRTRPTRRAHRPGFTLTRTR